MKLSMHVLDMAGSGNSGDNGCTSSGNCDSPHIDPVSLFRDVPLLVLLVSSFLRFLLFVMLLVVG